MFAPTLDLLLAELSVLLGRCLIECGRAASLAVLVLDGWIDPQHVPLSNVLRLANIVARVDQSPSIIRTAFVDQELGSLVEELHPEELLAIRHHHILFPGLNCLYFWLIIALYFDLLPLFGL